MNKSAVIRARVEPVLKAQVEAIFGDLGLTVSQAITLFLKQVELQHGLPFPVDIPNKETARVLKESEQDVDVVKSKSMAELFEKLDLDES